MAITPQQKRRMFRDLGRVDPEFDEKIMPFLDVLYRYYFRCVVTGCKAIRKAQALFVGNHNGLLTFEVLMLFYAWWNKFGGSRWALGLAHGVALNNPFFRWIIPRIGAIPAEPDLAYEAMARGYSLLV